MKNGCKLKHSVVSQVHSLEYNGVFNMTLREAIKAQLFKKIIGVIEKTPLSLDDVIDVLESMVQLLKDTKK